MNSKSKFFLSIFALSIILIGFLIGVFITAVLIANEGGTTERIGMLIINSGLSAIALVKMIRLSNQETESRIDTAVKDYHEFISCWSIPSDVWQRYHKAKLAFDISESNSYGYISGGIAGLVFLVSYVPSFDVINALSIAVAIFIVIFLVTKLGLDGVARKQFDKSLNVGSGEIYFAKDLIIINSQLILLKECGYQLKTVVKEERFGYEVLSLVVKKGFGCNKIQRSYFIPIPIGNGLDADKLVNDYRSLAN